MKNAQSIFYLIGTTILLIVINTIFFLFQTSKNEKNHSQSMTTYETIETATSLLDNLEDAESHYQNFVISHDSTLLTQYNIAEHRLDESYIKLYSLLNNIPFQQKNLSRLNELINLKRIQTNKTLRPDYKLKSSAQKNQDVSLIRKAETQIREIIHNITSTEKTNLNASNKVIEKLTRRIQIFTVISNWILLIIVISALVNILNGRDEIEKLFSEVESKNNLLEVQKNNLQKLSQDLIKQNSELERFAYVASHDLRSPGVNLISLLHLYDEAEEASEKEYLINIMKEVADNLIVKLDDLIDLLKNKHETINIREKLTFMQIYATVEKNLTADIKKSKAKLNFDFSEVPYLTYPRSFLESIMQNLLSNALKYHHPDRTPQISVRTYKLNEKTYLEIKDNGIGIDLKEHGSDIFGIYKTFHQLKDSKGVGLYITKAQIIAMGGSIEVTSKPNVGSTFTVCFG